MWPKWSYVIWPLAFPMWLHITLNNLDHLADLVVCWILQAYLHLRPLGLSDLSLINSFPISALFTFCFVLVSALRCSPTQYISQTQYCLSCFLSSISFTLIFFPFIAFSLPGTILYYSFCFHFFSFSCWITSTKYVYKIKIKKNSKFIQHMKNVA